MVYKHGVYSSDVPISLNSPVESTAGLQVVVGTAPINLAESLEYVNKPLLAYSYSEAVKAIGYSDDWEKYTLCEVMNCAFGLYGVAPIVFINVLDPKKHKTEVSTKSVNIIDKKATITDRGILLDTLKVKLTSGATSDLIKNTDYTATFDDLGNVIIAVIQGGTIPSDQTTLSVSFTQLDPSKVTATDIIGGTDVESGLSSGIELINNVFPKFGLIPGQILAPKYSKNPLVESVMKAKASNINTYFKAMAITDIDSSVATNYTKVSEWKNQNGFTSSNEVPCCPKVAMDDKVYHLSTQIASLINITDSNHEDMPYKSPSNETIKISKALVEDGKEINLGPDQAAYLNGEGIVTALNFIGGWKAWGNRTGIYPSIKNPKDSFIPVKRMHNWISNMIVVTTWQKVDNPLDRRLIDNVVDSINIWLNGLTASGALIGGRVEFKKEENSTEALMNGMVCFHVYHAAPTPAEDIEFLVEFDATYYSKIFE